MKLSESALKKLIRLAEGEAIPAGQLKGEWVELLKDEGLLIALTNGSRQRFRALNGETLRHFVAGRFGIEHLEKALDLLERGGASRAEQVAVSGDSKYLRRRVFSGFLVNSYEPISAILNNKPIVISPYEGAYIFIADFEEFRVQPDVVVVGVENAENFRHAARQRYLFERYGKILFISRYPLQQSKDLIRWLCSITNRYVHFGDLDLAGINIYQTEYYAHLGKRASFFLPYDYEERLLQGSRERYDTQLKKYRNLRAVDPDVAPLISAIHRIHRGYDQEGFIP